MLSLLDSFCLESCIFLAFVDIWSSPSFSHFSSGQELLPAWEPLGRWRESGWSAGSGLGTVAPGAIITSGGGRCGWVCRWWSRRWWRRSGWLVWREDDEKDGRWGSNIWECTRNRFATAPKMNLFCRLWKQQVLLSPPKLTNTRIGNAAKCWLSCHHDFLNFLHCHNMVLKFTLGCRSMSLWRTTGGAGWTRWAARRRRSSRLRRWSPKPGMMDFCVAFAHSHFSAI